MSKNYALLTIIGLVLILPLLNGCGQQEANPPITSKPLDSNMQQVRQSVNEENQSFSKEINNFVLNTFDSVAEVTNIKHNKEIIVAIKATTFQQINEQKIEKKVKNELENKYPNLKINVSSDQKIFIEVNQLRQEIKNNISNKESEKKYKKIKNLLADNA